MIVMGMCPELGAVYRHGNEPVKGEPSPCAMSLSNGEPSPCPELVEGRSLQRALSLSKGV